MKRKILVLFCVAVMTFTVLPMSGCRRNSGAQEINSSKTQLYVGTLDQGVGKGWLELVADRFEEAFADYELNGKKGVQVLIEGVDRATSLINNFKRERVEVVFNEGVDYETWVNKKLLLDITDAVSGKNADLSAYGDPEGTTIESKMDESAAEYYKTDDNKYYAIPFYEDTNGIMFNVDLWEKYGFYFKDGGGWTGNVKEATVGQDGKKGTYDDGLPRTFDDFFALCEHIQQTKSTKGGQPLIPIAWNGKYDLSYINSFLFCMAADVDGADQYSLNFTFNGEAEGLITGFDGTTPIISQTAETITDRDGYKLYRQQGKYYALKFIETIIDEGYYSNKIMNKSTIDHKTMQAYFIKTEDASQGAPLGQEIAMLIEGTWWFNEANEYFSTNEQYGGGKYEQRFGMMPLPKPTEDHVDGTHTLFNSKQSAAFINANIDESKIELAKEFLKFAHSNDSLVEFTETVSLLKPYAYTLSENNNLTYYAKQLLQVKEASENVYPFADSRLFTRQKGTLLSATSWAVKIGDHSYNHPTTDFLGGVSAEDYFNGLLFADKEYWQETFQNDFE